jgi:hypothetical protein
MQGEGTFNLRSDILVARVRLLLAASEYGKKPSDLSKVVEELCVYHLEIRDSALRLESELHAVIKRLEDAIN